MVLYHKTMKMKNKSSKIFSGILSILLALTMIVGIVPMSASAVTFSALNDSDVFLKQNGKTTCTLCSATMMLRRYSMLRGDSGWDTITESAVRPTAWIDGTGLKFSFTYSNSSVDAITVGHYSLPGGSANEAKIQEELKKCPEGIVIYYESLPHAVLLTDYTDGIYYCADPANNIERGRIPLTSAWKVRIDNVTAYWKVTSPVVQGPTDGSSGGTTHTHSYTDTVVAPTCTAQGYTTHTCSCGYSYTDSYVNALGHNRGAWTTTVEASCLTEGTEKVYCTRCRNELDSRQTDALGHDYASEVITEATCKGKGEMKYVCKRCEFTYYDVIEPKGHNHDEAIWTTTVAPTCTAKGEQTAYCPDCNELIDVRSVDSLGHDEGSWVVTTQPTCSDKGEETCYCTRCGKAVNKRSINALGHDDGTWIVVTQPTCREDGQEALFCTRCGKATQKRSIDSVGHDDGVWKIDFEATPNHDGQMSRYCTRCDEVLETKTFKMHKHTEGYRETVIEPTCTTDGEGGVFCADCGAKFGTYSIPALKHDYNDWYTNSNGTHSHTCSRCHNFESANCDYDVTVTEATCTEAGYTTHVCKICGYTYVDGNVEALGHSWSEWTDTEDGTAHTRICSGCGEVETVEHMWGDWVLNKDTTLCKNGTKTHTCEICGTSVTVEAIHTAWLVRIPYSIILWIGNLLKKLLYVISFQWFLPSHGIPPIH